MNPDLGADEEPTGAPIRVSDDGIALRKTVSTRKGEAVVVDLTIRSDREDNCEVRVEDALPTPVKGNPIEFHPRYDPDKWTETGDAVVYESPLGPGVVRRTVYGVIVDDLSQVELFRTEPTVETSEIEAAQAVEPSAEPTGGDPFEFTAAEGAFGNGAPPSSRHRPPDSAAHGDEDGSIVDALVAELRGRELSRRERAAIRSALDLESAPGDVDDLRRDVRGLEERTAELEAALEREARWREELRRLLLVEPGLD